MWDFICRSLCTAKGEILLSVCSLWDRQKSPILVILSSAQPYEGSTAIIPVSQREKWRFNLQELLAQGLTGMIPRGVYVPTSVPHSLGMQPAGTGGHEGLFSGCSRGGGIREPVRCDDL